MESGCPESDWIPVSALQHFAYCPRQCALIHISQVFDENIYTLRGRSVHRKAHEAGQDTRSGVRVERSLPIWCSRLGLTGKADLVEFRDQGPVPVEYKAGKVRNRRARDADRVQLCAQAICLEEMFEDPVEQGVLYYAGSRRRLSVEMTSSLRERTARVVDRVRNQLATATLPSPVNDQRCADCSLKEACVPSSEELSPERLRSYLNSLAATSDPA